MLGLLMLGSATSTAATAKEHHVHQSAGHRQRHADTAGPPFCGKAITPLAAGYSKPPAPNKARASATLLPCYKLELPGGVRTSPSRRVSLPAEGAYVPERRDWVITLRMPSALARASDRRPG